MIINPQFAAALLEATSGASDRRLRSRLGRRPSFGETLSQNLAGGLGNVPGQAIGSYIGGQIDTSNRRTLAEEERAYNEAPVEVPGRASGAPRVPRALRSTYLEADINTARDKARQEFEAGQNKAELGARYPDVPVTPELRTFIGAPEPMAPQAAGPLSGPMFQGLFDEANKQAGAVGATIPGDALDRIIKVKGDLATAADKAAIRKETNRANMAREENTRMGQASRERIAGIRASKGYDKVPLDRLKTEYITTAKAVGDLEKLVLKAKVDPMLYGEAKTATIDDLTMKLQSAREDHEAVRDTWGERTAGTLGTPEEEKTPDQAAGAAAPVAAKVPPASLDEPGLTKALAETPPGPELEALIQEAARRAGQGK